MPSIPEAPRRSRPRTGHNPELHNHSDNSSGGRIHARDLIGIPELTAASDHGLLLGLADDDHAQYLLLAGRAPSQTIAGATIFTTAPRFDIASAATGFTWTATDIDGNGIWATPAAAAAHDLLSAIHGDTVVNAVTRGSLIYGNSTPKWDELAIGAANAFLGSNGTDAAWTALPGGFAGFATPAANSVRGTAPSAGTATTAMRSDATLQIADAAVTLAKMADLFPGLFIGRKSLTTGVPETINSGEVRAMLGAISDVWPVAYGGTGKNLTLSNGGILWTDSDSFEVLAGTATAGQVLRSGASVTPSWSTATYPATAGTSGNVLSSDGANWTSVTVASLVDIARSWTTLQKFPDDNFEVVGSVTASKIMRFEVDNLADPGTRTLTPQDANYTIAGTTLALFGTGKSLTASAGGVVWTDSDSMEVLAGTATAGQVLRSGASVTPSWSTATYPATAGAAANVLRSDGTNWLSAAFAISDTTGTLAVGRGGTGATTFTAGRVLYGNGTSAINSSANLFFDGTQLGVGGTPAALLDMVVNSASLQRARITNSSTTNGAYTLFEATNGVTRGVLGMVTASDNTYGSGNPVIIGAVTDHPVVFISNNLARMTIIGSNVGIGTTTFGTSAACCLGFLGGTAPTTSPTNVGQLYTNNGHLYFRSAGGKTSLLALNT